MNFYEKAKLYAKDKISLWKLQHKREEIDRLKNKEPVKINPKTLTIDRDWEDIKKAKQMFRQNKYRDYIKRRYPNYLEFIEKEDRAWRKKNPSN